MSYEQTADAQLLPVLRYTEHERPGDAVGAYLFGSSVSSGLRPESDIDVMMLTGRSMSTTERRGLVDLLLPISGWKGHADRFPDAARRRPIDFTSLVTADVESWTSAPLRDFQYGEWLRDALLRGYLPEPAQDPDVIVLAATALQSHRVLFGLALDTVLAPVPPEVLHDAVVATIPEVHAGLEDDERNTLLALARVLVTLETGRIVPKDAAVDMVVDSLSGRGRVLLEHARDDYRGVAARSWNSDASGVAALADHLARLAEKLGAQSAEDLQS